MGRPLRGAPSLTSAGHCPHFDVQKDTGLLARYAKFWQRLSTLKTISELSVPAKAKALEVLNLNEFELRCSECDGGGDGGNESEFGPLYACLACGTLGCWRLDGSECHLSRHLVQSQHFVAMEVSSGTVFCGACNAFIWNGPLALAACGELPEALQESDESSFAHCVSMRGLVNMGSTCFMSSALQVLLHCDPLVRYFLSAGHALKRCSKRSKAAAAGATGAASGAVCLACEFDTLFNQNYAGQSSPYAPHQLLHAIWRSSKHLAGYEQQDAHEFLISTLNQLHTDLGGSHFACKCPVHLTFTGVLQSDVTCSSCGTVNASFDPFLDISLDILTSHASDFVVDPNGSSLSLGECFQLFTCAEKLSPNTYMCSACNHTYQEATKQLSIRKAPEILTIHLKRFEHSFNTVKIDTFLRFPLEFSIFDYTTEGVHLNNELTRISAMSGGLSPTIIDPLYNQKKYAASLLYRLIGIINHLGSVDSGHYVSYVVHPGDPTVWFKFDDATVSKVSVSVVLNSNPYMLFYQRVGELEGIDDISLVE